MKRLLALLMSIFLFAACFACLTGCEKESCELALVEDIGGVDSQAVNECCRDGLQRYASESGITSASYRPEAASEEARAAAIELAIANGAKLVVAPGALYDIAVNTCAAKYPDIKFIHIDGEPETLQANTYCVHYAEEQAGFLAGYAAVKDGFTKLGFQGGMSTAAVVRYGYGFVQGADYAAKELELEKGRVEIMYNYSGSLSDTPETEQRASGWYENGCEVIFACGGQVIDSVAAAAEKQEDKWVIGADTDRYSLSDRVISSAVKGMSDSVFSAVKAYYGNRFPGGLIATLTAAEGGVGIAMEHAKWRTFTKADADDVTAKLIDGSIALIKDGEADAPDSLGTTVVSVSVIE